MSRTRRLGRLGGLAAVAVAATPFACLWVVSVAGAGGPLTVRARLDLDYLFLAVPVVLLAGSAAVAAVGRSFRAGVWACAWAVVAAMPLLVGTWLAEALRWNQQRG